MRRHPRRHPRPRPRIHDPGHRPPHQPHAPDADADATVPQVNSRQIIDYALATVTAKGAGLAHQPKPGNVVGIPTLVHAENPTQTLTTTLFGRTITINLQATHYSYDFGDSTPTLETDDPSGPYPIKRLQHTYTEKHPGRVITLTTTWAGTVTNPFTGRTDTINGVLTTTEATPPIPVHKYDVVLTDDAEEAMGH